MLIVAIITTIIIKIASSTNSVLYPKAKVTGNGDTKIACVGDSITYGIGVVNNRDNSWVSLLANELGDNYKTINYGLTNRTLLSSGNMPYMKEKLAKKFWNRKENIILFMLGTNDTKEINWDYDKFNKEYREVLDKMLEKKRNSKIYIMIPPEIYINKPSKTEPNKDNLENGVVPILNEINEDYKGIEIIDLYTYTLNHKEWFTDSLHPNKQGNKEIAKEIARIIKETYNEKGVKRVSK